MKKPAIISAGNNTTAEAVADVIQSGGNAFDGAMAGVFMAMVSEPALTSAGGGGFLMAYPENRKPILYDFFVDMPIGNSKSPDFFSIEVDFGDSQQEFHIGRGSVAVPGIIAGLLHVHNQLGKIPLKEVVTPAINAGKNGIALSHKQAYFLDILEPIMCHNDAGKKIFCSGDKLIQTNETLKMEKFADFLDTLSLEGVDFFYKGEIAELIVDFQMEGGFITHKDMEKYSVVERNPIVTAFNGYQVLSNPPPAVSGLLVDFILRLLQSRGCSDDHQISIQEMVYAFEITGLARAEHLQDFSQKMEIDMSNVFEKYRKMFLENLNKPASGNLPENRNGSTTHISIIDKSGNAASVTTTNGEGCGYVLPQAGFMLNNMLGEEDLNPLGFHKHPPGARLPSMVAPTIVLKDGKPVLVTGTAGSNRIRSVIVQMIVNIFCNGMDIETATRHPRVHLEGNILHVEPGIPNTILEMLSARYKIHHWKEQNVFFGGANSVLNSEGMGDPRRGGYTITV